MGKTAVVHCLRDKFDVYIGRANPRFPNGGKWGNPFVVGKDGTRSEVIKRYREWILEQPELLAEVHTLKGKVLGCWCAPKDGFKGRVLCHGQILGALAEGCGPEEIE